MFFGNVKIWSMLFQLPEQRIVAAAFFLSLSHLIILPFLRFMVSIFNDPDASVCVCVFGNRIIVWCRKAFAMLQAFLMYAFFIRTLCSERAKIFKSSEKCDEKSPKAHGLPSIRKTPTSKTRCEREKKRHRIVYTFSYFLTHFLVG